VVTANFLQANGDINVQYPRGQVTLLPWLCNIPGIFTYYNDKHNCQYDPYVWLVRNGADMNKGYDDFRDGRTTIHYACSLGNAQLLQLLLENHRQSNPTATVDLIQLKCNGQYNTVFLEMDHSKEYLCQW
jgi:ankyrin repeat protein